MAFFLDLAAWICGTDYDDEDQIDFCGMPSDQIVEIAVRRDFLLCRLQALVDAETLEDAQDAMVAMEKEAKNDDKLLRFLVRAGTVEIIRGCKVGVGSEASESLMTKLQPFHEQRGLKELERKRRGSWGMINSSGR